MTRKLGWDRRVDRHQHIGLGHIGAEAFSRLTRNLKFRKIPFILETPIDKEYSDEWNLRRIRSLSEGDYIKPLAARYHLHSLTPFTGHLVEYNPKRRQDFPPAGRHFDHERKVFPKRGRAKVAEILG